jgi:hypothetical protein
MPDQRPRKPKTHVHDAEMHKKAYEVYRLSKNLSDVQRTMGLTYDTVLRWKQANLVCSWGCPYHGWDELVEQELNVMAAKEKAIAAGITDPAEQQRAMEIALANKTPFQAPAPTEREMKRAVKMVITEEQMLGHWRHLYAKAYFDLTGVVMDFETLLEDSTGTTSLYKEELFKKGLRFTSSEQGMRTLGYIMDKIKELERRIMGTDVITTTATQVTDRKAEMLDDASPETLRKMLVAMDKIPAAGLKQVAEVVGEDEDDKQD